MSDTQMSAVQRNHKDTVFRMLYRQKAEAMELYNALNGTDYHEEKDFRFTTLENAIFMNVKNDVSFLLGNDLNLYEHQSTVNVNLPLRDLFYISSQLQRDVGAEEGIYGSRLLRIPTPRFVVFFYEPNGGAGAGTESNGVKHQCGKQCGAFIKMQIPAGVHAVCGAGAEVPKNDAVGESGNHSGG